ncbi:uncharacterized protein LOC119575116 isoform X2 [Penaeus monodon]|uniref:uncharacterized protein LOC119575116 isoform X2 n=1 Tax=Penaeus monodon TaxID=6687 RepID=UPI0018A75921|nr:uncharacterized protein LOC119575116 isoform X2 [Penaeus monodon]XP_037778468.1 uncharacterized protein LOC119575116 isoform X2 [Penaeus monodon]XP_037778469.1 uncharacterized protein LOC119575116 isoform X2 [Penaeus monodon]XP_037778470.1 uncharacterized protein LOC119575116 isoform X2 [Penaeus monodon]XP_037778471.1 uncharacterized protein LOC119575116 isoform X2 [Penaeus monodon]XP_037778472.1 uncharacterized protein LOC119575116 isoform X2 [Penaeus monodon]
MRTITWAFAWALLAAWACPTGHASSPIRISAYPYTGFGRRLPVDPSEKERPRRNATFVVPDSQVGIPGNNTTEEKEEEEQARTNAGGDAEGGTTPGEEERETERTEEEEGEEREGREEGVLSVNRMGIPARVSRRKLPSRPRGPSPRIARPQEDTTHRNLPRPPSIRPPAIPEADGFGPPSTPLGAVQPPAPPNGLPPSTPPPALIGTTFGPPAIPIPISSPSPPPGADRTQVTDIKCIDTGSASSFMAVLNLPVGYNSIPVFEDRPTVDPTINTACRMIPTQITNDMFQLVVRDLERCGVQRCRQPNGETWLCLNLRFPLVNGLKLPEDEIIQIKCRPQDKMAQDTHVLTVATAMYAAKGAIKQPSDPSVFEGGQQEFMCEIGLFRKLRGTNLFADQVTSQVELELGEEVQLRSIVRTGDGWQYSRLTTIIIQKVGAPRERSLLSAADLVFADGCRNPTYRLIAREHPKRDPRNPLINNFTFRVFMFQDMEVGDNLMITANVIGCVDAEDCAAVNCEGELGEDTLGFGKRKRREVRHFTFTKIIPASDILASSPPYPPTPTPSLRVRRASQAHQPHKNTTSWERNLAIKVRIPEAPVRQKYVDSEECRLYLFITLGVAGVFCISSVVFVVFTLLRGRSASKKVGQSVPVAPVAMSPPMPPKFSSTASTCSSSLPSLRESEVSAVASPLRDFPVPPTVRQRKRDLNAELLNVFGGDQAFSYGSHYPGMFNYYGYMVVPRKASEKADKRSLRALKKRQRRERLEPTCQCASGRRETDDRDANISTENHKAIIRISSSDSDTVPTPCLSHRPKPMPRMKKESEYDNIYSEISVDEEPTMV